MLHLIFLYDCNRPPVYSDEHPLQHKDANGSGFPDLTSFGTIMKDISQIYDSFLITNASNDESTQNWLQDMVYRNILSQLRIFTLTM